MLEPPAPSCGLLVPAQDMVDVKFVFVTDSHVKRTNQREIELLLQDAKSHSAKISHARRKFKLNQASKDVAHLGSFVHPLLQRTSATKSSSEHDDNVKRRVRPVAILPRPRSPLGQGKIDPFRTGQPTELPAVMHECMAFVYEVLWPMNSPALEGTSLRQAINTWRGDAITNPLIYHSQIMYATTLCFSATTDPAVRKTLWDVRLAHQSIVLRLMRDAVAALGDAKPSIPLITCVVNMGVSGGQFLDEVAQEDLPESPIFAGFNHKPYSKFTTPPEHFHALFYLVQNRGGIDEIPPEVAHAIQLADVWVASMQFWAPIFPVCSAARKAIKEKKYCFDEEAISMRSVLGTGFHLGSTAGDNVLRALVSRCCDITAAIEQYRRGAPGKSRLHELALQSICLQHGLLSLPELSPDTGVLSSEECDYEIMRISLLIYGSLVFFPANPGARVKQRLAGLLKERITLRCENHVDLVLPTCSPASISTLDDDQLLWSLVLGGVACLESPDRAWYISQISSHILRRRLSLTELETIPGRFLYYDFVLSRPVTQLGLDVGRHSAKREELDSSADGDPKTCTLRDLLTEVDESLSPSSPACRLGNKHA